MKIPELIGFVLAFLVIFLQMVSVEGFGQALFGGFWVGIVIAVIVNCLRSMGFFGKPKEE